ncbi:MAG: OmpA family protein [Lachnospiraceae bacterium]
MKKGGKFSNEDNEDDEEGANWQDSYSDLVTDLLAIFVVLFAFAMMEQAYSNAAKSAANDSIVVMEGQGSSPLAGNDGVLDGQDSLFAEQSSVISGDGQAQGQSGDEQQANSAQSADASQNADTAQGADANQNAAASQGENADQNANAQGADANQGVNGNQNANAQGADGSQNANQGINGNQNANAQGANGSQNANQGINGNQNANAQGAKGNQNANQGKNGNQNANAQGANDDQGANENVEDFLDSTDLYVGASEYEDQISVSRQGNNEVLLRINGSILFDLGKAKVSPNAESTLRKVGDILTANKDSISMVRVEGHTDNIPINSLEFESNWELSTFRAVNVVKWLLKNSTLSEELFSAVGYGEYHPISDNDSSEGRARNRRVDFIIELKSDGTQ